MLQSSSSEKKLVKALKNCFFGPNLHRKGVIMGHTQDGNLLFLAEITKADYQPQKVFILSKYMFWLSYESFSILSDVFCQKSVISSKNSCEENFHGKWMMTVHNCIKVKLLCYGRINEAFHSFLQLGNMYFSSWDMSFFVTSVLQKICWSNFWNIQNEQVVT